jgi:hypothetical protein
MVRPERLRLSDWQVVKKPMRPIVAPRRGGPLWGGTYI